MKTVTTLDTVCLILEEATAYIQVLDTFLRVKFVSSIVSGIVVRKDGPPLLIEDGKATIFNEKRNHI